MNPSWIDTAIAHAVARVRGIADEVTDFPHITEAGQWKTTPDGVWTGGFWAGLLWLAQLSEPDETNLKAALAYTERLLPRAHDQHNHDLGFMFYPSAIRAWQHTGNPRYRQAALDAAQALAAQFNPRGQYIPGWGFFGAEDWSGSTLVDTLMNLPLLVWADGQQPDPRLRNVVEQHARTSLRYHLRENGSVYHVYRFDPDTGQQLGGATYQGLEAESAWARGQAWALTGLAILSAMTGEPRFIEASRRIAHYFISKLPAHGIAPWDFAVTDPDAPRDASASAIACYGLLKLHEQSRDASGLQQAASILKSLACQCGNTTSKGGLLLHATADLPHGLGIDESTMYGDYYYLKSLLKLRALSA